MSVTTLIAGKVVGGIMGGPVGVALSSVPRWLWEALAAVLLVALVWWRIDHAAYDRGRRSRDGEVSAVKQSLTTALGNTATLQAAIDSQNAAVAAVAADSAKRQQQGQAALKAAVRREAALSGTVAALEAHGRAVAAPGCPVSAINRRALEDAL
jgi:hypothetical protein